MRPLTQAEKDILYAGVVMCICIGFGGLVALVLIKLFL